jgi:hypothetical protein
MHSLKPVRPPVWIDELPWHELNLDGELDLRCEGEQARGLEWSFRSTLFRWKWFQVDMVVENAFYVGKSCTNTGTGARIKEETLATDKKNGIVSHHYEDQLDTEEKVEALRLPVVTAQPEKDRENLAFFGELFDGILPVKLRGHGVYYAPWDEISMLRGVTNCLTDIIDRPEFIHKTIQKFTEIGLSWYSQLEAQGLLDFSQSNLHCTPPYCDELPAKDWDGGKVRMKDIWFRGMAQPLSTVSPAMRDEFDLQYMRQLMDKCALSYYGCCEPLDLFIPYLKKVPNMRKIGVTPWAGLRSSAEQIGGDYVLAYKPNPANVAVFNPETVRAEITAVIDAARENKCPYEFVLKDVSTVGYKPQNLFAWAKTAMSVIGEYYG